MKCTVPVALVALSMLPLVALAHAHLQHSAPADGSVVGAAPGSVTLVFSESAHLTALSIQKQGEAQARKIEPLPKDASEHFAIPVPNVGAGSYTLKYRVVSADDNHISSGEIKFTVSTARAGNPG